MSLLITLLLALSMQDAEPAAPREDVPIPPKVEAAAPVEAEPEASAATPAGDPPTVSIRTEPNGDRVEEYRQNGQLYMVKVTPERGPAYYLMDTDNNGRLNRDERDPRVSPVHWTVYEWD